jgi:hypothetical protein
MMEKDKKMEIKLQDLSPPATETVNDQVRAKVALSIKAFTLQHTLRDPVDQLIVKEYNELRRNGARI